MSEPLDDLANVASTASNRNAPSWARVPSRRAPTAYNPPSRIDAGEAFRWGFFAGFGIWAAWLVCSIAVFLFFFITGFTHGFITAFFR